jgi:5-methyltetrahydrofolate--homocysteine methyltransferase
MAHLFLERLRKGVMLCDGAMGTLLNMQGVSFKRSFEELNISNPQMVLGVHRDYIKAGVEIIGVNCGVGPQNMADITKSLSQTSSKKLSIQPSAGLPRYVDGSFIYPTSPEYFPECTKDCIIAGANIIGGCCGTTPEFIRSLSRMLKNSNSAATDTHGLMK